VKLHVLLAGPDLLRPEPWPAAALAALGGRPTAAPSALWLGPSREGADHDYLLSREDARLKVFAAALRENFGRRVEPVLAFRRLAASPHAPRDPGEIAPAAALSALVRDAGAEALVLHDVALAPDVDPEGLVDRTDRAARFERVTAALGAEGLGGAPVERIPLELAPGEPCFLPALLNGIARRIVREAPPSERRAGLALAAPGVVAQAVRAALGRRIDLGFAPALPLEAAALARLGARLLDEVAERGSG
jgi:hypothetical protein